VPNRLINESSPYLLQHANNPVDWYPWGDEAFAKAKKENKLMLISIGYSACHWCHVMEHESFEDAEVAKLMNEKYVCIKIDREERPDVDQLYMDAVQIISGRGGWPLNCFTLPSGMPVFGGTYFPKEQWTDVLHNLDTIYREDPNKVLEFAEELKHGILHISRLIDYKESTEEVDIKFIDALVAKMEGSFDNVNGGYNHAPKFPMPTNYEFLLYYTYVLKNANRADEANKIDAHVFLTLDKMAMGGIYDQLGGGFARYSTDSFWKAPHFEKMLYDNGQLMSLYSKAWQCNPKKLYKEVVYGIYEFITKDLISPEHGFYCALDADSEGREGEYYIWKKQELQMLLVDEFSLFAEYYSVKDADVWEEERFILFRKMDDESFSKKNNITSEQLEEKKKAWSDILGPYRRKRVAPGLDDKILASWNGIMLKGLTDAFKAFGDLSFLDTAIKNANFISEKLIANDGALWRTCKNGKTAIPAFHDDYALVADAFFNLYQCTFDEKWLTLCTRLIDYTFTHFYEKAKNIFYYTANYHKAIITRKAETIDNVIPASNSVMANLLFGLGHCLGNEEYIKVAKGMCTTVKNAMTSYPSGHSHWGVLMLHNWCGFFEVAITGPDANKQRDAINTQYLPNKIILGASNTSALELLKEKFIGDKTLIYVCENKTCFAPVSSTEEAIPIIKRVK
jgi:uncharacterized protein YyaL (SSP411 family)